MQDITGWIAPIATMIAAMMTAANLGARITGWGFVVFMIGSVCWSIVGAISGQTNLLATNAFLTLVNLVGIWRWLGRQRAYEDGGKSAEEASKCSQSPSLFTATGLAGLPLEDRNGERLGTAVEALLECESARVSYVVIAEDRAAGLDEVLRAVAREALDFTSDRLVYRGHRLGFHALPSLGNGDWPVQPVSSRAVDV